MTARRFVTRAGVEAPAVSAEQMREVDRVAVEETGPNLFQMMENAGRSLALAVIDLLGPRWATTPVVVASGVGGNGGGGICAARHLANHGAYVSLVVSEPSRLQRVPAAQLAVFRGTDGRTVTPDEILTVEPGLVVDALVGYGLGGPPRGVTAEVIEWMFAQRAPVVALDVPSGVDATTGETPGAFVRAERTVTLALPKAGLGAGSAGEVWLADIGIPSEVYRRVGIDVPAGLFGSDYLVELIVT